MLKTGAPFLMYLYYALENQSSFYRFLWRCSDILRRIICKLPSGVKHLVTDIIAILIYFPLSKISLVLEKCKMNISGFPLSFYRNCSFYTMRTDARDRFGTPLEQRFSRDEIKKMMEKAGLHSIHFSEHAPFWCAMGRKR